MAKKVSITLSDAEYDAIVEIANAGGQSVTAVTAQCVRAGMPPTLQKVPAEFHAELLALNRLEDRALLDIADGAGPKPRGKGQLYKKADFLALRRTYALSLLRWRGHPIAPYGAF